MELLTSDDIFNKIEQILESANKSIKLSSAWISGGHFDRMINIIKKKGNVDFEVIIRTNEFKDLTITKDDVFRKIKDAGGCIYFCDRLHAKFIIVDESKAVLGSANFTDHGLSKLNTGNIEAGVFYDDGENIKKLNDYFELMKKDHSKALENDLIGFALNPTKNNSFEFLLLDDNVELESYVEVRLKEGMVLGKVSSILAYNMGFFANPFTAQQSVVFAPFDQFKQIFFGEKDSDWRIASLYAYSKDNASRVKITTASVVGILKGDKLEPLLKPFDVGEPIYRVSKDNLENALKKTFSGQDMNIPIEVGILKSSLKSEIKAFIDAEEVISKHMLIIGTTGSGKSHFTKRFLRNLLEKHDIQLFIMDPHGEYLEALKDFKDKDQLEHIQFQDTIFLVDPEEMIELLKDAGYGNIVSGNSSIANENRAAISKAIKPYLNEGESNLINLLKKLKVKEDGKDKTNKNNEENKKQSTITTNEINDNEIIKSLEKIYGQKQLSNQDEIRKLILKALKSTKRIILCDFKSITHPSSRTNIAGLIMQEIFNQNKDNPRDRLIVLEEAHNFAPERGYGDSSSGSDNLSLRLTRKIASEGRKFRLGLLAITQRPAQISKYVLSQLNTQALFRTINSADLEVMASLIEHANQEIIQLLPSLTTGMCIVSGVGVSFPLFIEGRE